MVDCMSYCRVVKSDVVGSRVFGVLGTMKESVWSELWSCKGHRNSSVNPKSIDLKTGT